MDAETLKHHYYFCFHIGITNEPKVDEFCRLLRRNKIDYNRHTVNETVFVDFIAINKDLPLDIRYFMERHIDEFYKHSLTNSQN